MSLKYITMPKWGIEMQQGTLTEWHVKEGESVEKGQLIALVETDKITNEMEADAPGVLHKALVPEGEVRVVGTPRSYWRRRCRPIGGRSFYRSF